jgi:hypothetical protein
MWTTSGLCRLELRQQSTPLLSAFRLDLQFIKQQIFEHLKGVEKGLSGLY